MLQVVSQRSEKAMTNSPTPSEKIPRLKVRPIQKSSISDKIVQQIMTLISNGDLKPGQRLPSERELCKKFAAGRSSLREALRCLSIMGVLSAKVGDGTTVAMDGSKFMETVLQWRLMTEHHDIEDLMQVRIALEGLAAASAARRGNTPAIQMIQDLVGKMDESMDDPKRFAALDLDFHLALAKASENSLLLDLVSMIRGQLARAVTKMMLLPGELPISVEEHRAVFQAIKQGKPEEACTAIQSHLDAALHRYRKAIENSPELLNAES
jgi:GntR family transcriptional regulator, transcriptional repressor for pyruvate dehydrogenase complex